MTTLVMNNCTEVFVPLPAIEEAEDCSHRTENPVVLQCDDGEVLAFPGPLLRADMQKDKLMRFIQQKRQECLLHLDEPQQQKSFFFWSIMERFCNSNGRVMMSEMAVVLFKGYGLLRKKLGPVKNQEWCLPLAGLLCSNSPEDQHREAIIKMGNDFASRNWTYAAHICFVLAQVELGSYQNYELIGCKWLPEDIPAKMEAIERTEVYEYVLSLTSGFGQTCFQRLKSIYAFELFELGHFAQTLQYCETIAAEVIRCPSHADSNLIMLLKMLSGTVLRKMKKEETEWLQKLQQLLESQSSTQFHPSQHSELASIYTTTELLGEGGFGSVYAGVRKIDGKTVAVKCVPKETCMEYITIRGETHRLPLEVALMVMVSKPYCENVVELLEWFETSEFFILVLERPDSCMDLHKYCNFGSTKLSEGVSRTIMEQVVQAARHCCNCGVLHRDIKPENVLINPHTLEVKLIDFGCGELLKDEVYNNYIGTPVYYPPEWIVHNEYFGVPVTIWSLGVFLYELVCGTTPYNNFQEIAEGNLTLPTDVSEECCMLIRWCLEHDPKNRPTFEEILNHKWFMLELQDMDQARQME